MRSTRLYKSPRNSIIPLIFCMFCGVFLASCAANLKSPFGNKQADQVSGSEFPVETPPTKKSNVKVALLLPLGSKQKRTANIAKSLKQAGELALFDFDNPNIVLITKRYKRNTRRG